MTTIATLAAEYDMQPYEVAAGLDLGADYDETATLDESTEAEYRDQLDALRAVAERDQA